MNIASCLGHRCLSDTLFPSLLHLSFHDCTYYLEDGACRQAEALPHRVVCRACPPVFLEQKEGTCALGCTGGCKGLSAKSCLCEEWTTSSHRVRSTVSAQLQGLTWDVEGKPWLLIG